MTHRHTQCNQNFIKNRITANTNIQTPNEQTNERLTCLLVKLELSYEKFFLFSSSAPLEIIKICWAKVAGQTIMPPFLHRNLKTETLISNFRVFYVLLLTVSHYFVIMFKPAVKVNIFSVRIHDKPTNYYLKNQNNKEFMN